MGRCTRSKSLPIWSVLNEEQDAVGGEGDQQGRSGAVWEVAKGFEDRASSVACVISDQSGVTGGGAAAKIDRGDYRGVAAGGPAGNPTCHRASRSVDDSERGRRDRISR